MSYDQNAILNTILPTLPYLDHFSFFNCSLYRLEAIVIGLKLISYQNCKTSRFSLLLYISKKSEKFVTCTYNTFFSLFYTKKWILDFPPRRKSSSKNSHQNICWSGRKDYHFWTEKVHDYTSRGSLLLPDSHKFFKSKTTGHTTSGLGVIPSSSCTALV